MKKTILICSFLLLLSGRIAKAQESSAQSQWHHNIYLDAGPRFASHHSPSLDGFRPIGGYGSYINVNSWSSQWQVSARYELVAPGYHWAFRTGVQYTYHFKQLGYQALDPEEMQDPFATPSYYLFEIANDDNQLEYARIRGIGQTTHYVGIPLELRYYFTSKLPAFRMYLLAEADLDFCIGNTNTVNFMSDAMTPYSDQIMARYSNPDPWSLATYFGFGFQVGDLKGIGVGFNWLLHIYRFNGDTGLLNNLSALGGSKLNIELLIPIK